MDPVTRRRLRFVLRTALLLLLLIAAGLTGGVLAPSPAAAQATPPPVVSSISPDAGPAAGGTPVTITGNGFDTRPGATRFRGVATFFQSFEFTGVTCQSTTHCTAVSPSTPAGAGEALSARIVATVDGRESNQNVVFAWYGRPILDKLSPLAGPDSGGTLVSFHGRAFPAGLSFPGLVTVRFGNDPGVNVACPAQTLCVANSFGGQGTVQVTISTPGGTSNALPFTYGAFPVGPPTVTNLSPAVGSPTEHTRVTITGTGFSTRSGEMGFGAIGGVQFSDVRCDSPTHCAALAPPRQMPQGTAVPDTIVGNVGSTFGTAGFPFFYYGQPRLDSISPAAGSALGGTVVTLSGAAFPNKGSSPLPGPVSVRFGATASTNVNCSSQTACTATAPPGTTGAVQVTITTPGGTSSGRPFRYGAPVVLSVTPNFASATRDTHVTIEGEGFSTAPGATRFGNQAQVQFHSVHCPSTTRCTAVAPAQPVEGGGAGNWFAIEVLVTVDGQTNLTPPHPHFTWYGQPIINSISPTFGPTSGGTAVVISGSYFPNPLDQVTGQVSVRFGDREATSVTCPAALQGSSCTAIAPSGTGSVPVTITTPGGTSNSMQFFFGALPLPTVTGIEPNYASADHGATVTIHGAGFDTRSGQTRFLAGNIDIRTHSCRSSTECTASVQPKKGTPPGVAITETVLAEVESWRGTQGVPFTLYGPPRLNSISPNVGSSFTATTVTLTGATFPNGPGGLPGPVRVRFGSHEATNVTCTSATTCTAVTAGGQGMVEVKIITPGGESIGLPFDYGTPMLIHGTAEIDGRHAPEGAIVQAFIGSTACGGMDDPVGRGGSFFMKVGSAAVLPGCGTPGVTVRFTINGLPATPAVTFESGRTIKLTIRASTGSPPQCAICGQAP